MKRFWVEKKYFYNDEITLEGDSYHHICDVCRQDVGSKFEVLSEGMAYFVELTKLNTVKGKKTATAMIREVREAPAPKKPYIHLAVSISKFQTMETIVEKAVELGACALYPFVSEFSFIRDKNSDRLKDKLDRWNRIVVAATQQTGRGDLMKISSVMSLKELVEKMNQSDRFAGLFPYEGVSDQTVASAIKSMKSEDPENIWLFVGSEGGYSHQEVKFFRENGLKSSTLGDQVLRVETACLSLLSILKYEFNS
jgi:16S rRNA (uracil1498-N3)-methyltransferase